jgi:Baseplate J-like protein
MSSSANCPCDVFAHPRTIVNLPGSTVIRYRIGDYTSFRHALLLSLTDALGHSLEVELANWKPAAGSDLALQMVEWWAYLADVLTFYNERVANGNYLDTADEDNVKRLIRLLGYRPRPGIGAQVTLAAITKTKTPFTLAKGFAVQSKPGPGKQPQIFELDPDTVVQPLSQVSADPLPVAVTLGADATVLVAGNVSSVATGDQLLLVERDWAGTDSNYKFARVATVAQEKDPRSRANTRIRFTSALGLPNGALASSYRLMRSTQTARPWQYAGSDGAISSSGNSGTVHLDSVARQIHPGDMILFDASPSRARSLVGKEVKTTATLAARSAQFTAEKVSEFVAMNAAASILLPAADSQENSSLEEFAIDEVFSRPDERMAILPSPALQLSSVTAYAEQIWYANGSGDPPTSPPTDPTIPGIAILHSVLTFTPAYPGNLNLPALVIRHGWQDVGTLIRTPATSFSPSSPQLLAIKPPNFPSGSTPALLEDAKGNGESATGFTGSDTTATQLSNLAPDAPTLSAPVNVLFNLLNMSRGKTVLNEVLGSGDASVAAQEFVLKKSPLTYLLSTDSSSIGNYKSTLQLWVNGIQWKEVPSFYQQPAMACIFVTYEDENHQTHVQFGDGINGARLTSGKNNVVASYRYGSGAEVPDAGKLTTIVSPQPGLSAVRNPVAAGGGADPEPASQIRRYAPLSVLTFGRAVSGDDYEAIAASAPGVSRARAYWSFDSLQQRTIVTVYVGNGDAAVNAAQVSLSADADPNRPVSVKLATAVPVRISFTLVVDGRYISDDIKAAVQNALLDPDTGLFGANRVGIGEVVYASRIYEACFSVPGVLAVHSLNVHAGLYLPFRWSALLRMRFRLKTAIPQTVSSSSSIPAIFTFGPQYRFDPGEGAFYSMESSALTITTEVVNNAG